MVGSFVSVRKVLNLKIRETLLFVACRVRRSKPAWWICMLVLSCSCFASGDVDWTARSRALSHTTFTWELSLKNVMVVRRPTPKQTFGNSGISFPAITQGWDLRGKTKFRIVRDGSTIVIDGEEPSTNVDGKPFFDPTPVLGFSSPGWVGGIKEAPVRGPLTGPRGGICEIFNGFETVENGENPGQDGIFGGELNPFLYGGNLSNVCDLKFSVEHGPNGVSIWTGRNYDSKINLTTDMDRNAPRDSIYTISRDGRLLGMENWIAKWSEQTRLPASTIKVLQWRMVNGYAIPSLFALHHNNDISGRMYSGYYDETFKLLKVAPTPTNESFPPVDLGTRMADWRLMDHKYYIGMIIPNDEKPMFYKWTGKLPTIDELKRMRAADDANSFQFASVLSYGIPIFLISLGAGLIYRERRSKRSSHAKSA